MPETISRSGSFIPEQTHNHPGQSKSLGQCSLGKVYFCWPLCSSAFGKLGIVNLKEKKWVGGCIHTEYWTWSGHFPFPLLSPITKTNLTFFNCIILPIIIVKSSIIILLTF